MVKSVPFIREPPYRELLLGSGARTEKLVAHDGDLSWKNLTTLDMSAEHKPDVVWNLDNPSLPFAANTFDEVAAYDTLEHCGAQGDWRFFFRQFDDFWRILKPGGRFMGICPKATSPWAWGDPGHTRVILPETLVFLDRTNYGKPPMTDYRPYFHGDFHLEHCADCSEHQYAFVLRAVKPARG